MKKTIMFTLACVSILLVGCAMNEKKSIPNASINQSSINMDKLANARFRDIEKSFGMPYSSVFYIDADKVKGKDINTLTMDDLRDSITVQSAYKMNNGNDSFLHIYYENGKVKDAVSGNYNLFNSNKFEKNLKVPKSGYKVEFYNSKGMICNKEFTSQYAKRDFIGKAVKDFNKTYKVDSANFIASVINGTEKLYFYPLVPCDLHPNQKINHPNYSSNNDLKNSIVNPVNNNISIANQTDNDNLVNYAKSAVLLYTKDNIIKSIEVVDNNFIYGLISKSFNK